MISINKLSKSNVFKYNIIGGNSIASGRDSIISPNSVAVNEGALDDNKKHFVIFDNKKVEVNSMEKCIEVIEKEYRHGDICVGELLSNVEIQGFSIDNVVDIYAKIIKDIEDDYLMQGNDEENSSYKRGVF